MCLNTYYGDNVVYSLATTYVQVDTIVSGGSTTIQTHCIVTAWESPGDSHSFLTYNRHYLSCCNPIEVDFSMIVGYRISYFKDIYA